MSLDRLLAEVRGCRFCEETPTFRPGLPHAPRPVLQAHPAARICIAGQAPGVRVHASGRPFTDPSGDRLRDWLGVEPDVFYDPARFALVPMGFCFPGLDAKGSDLPPRKECAPRWRARIFAELTELKLLLIVGQYALRWHVRDKRYGSMTEAVRDHEALLARPLPSLVLPHPSWRNSGWLKKNPWFSAELLPVLRQHVSNLI